MLSRSTREKGRTVQILFYRPVKNDVFMNQLVAYFDPPFCHVEVRFEDGMASSIFAGERLFFKQRTYANPNYLIEAISVPESDYMVMYRLCVDRERAGVGFDSFGMYTSLVPLIHRASSTHTFCSRHVTEVLQAGNVPEVAGLCASKVSPSRLYHLLKGSKRAVIDSVPFKIGKMVECISNKAAAKAITRSPMENPRLNPRLQQSDESIPAITFKRF
jgi:hypothetical protein